MDQDIIPHSQVNTLYVQGNASQVHSSNWCQIYHSQPTVEWEIQIVSKEEIFITNIRTYYLQKKNIIFFLNVETPWW